MLTRVSREMLSAEVQALLGAIGADFGTGNAAVAADCNAIAAGFAYFSTNGETLNGPDPAIFWAGVHVQRTTDRALQVVGRVSGSVSAQPPDIRFRAGVGDGWTAWTPLAGTGGGGEGGGVIEHYSTGFHDGVNGTVPIGATAGAFSNWTIVDRLQLPNLANGDVVVVTSQVQGTNDRGYNVRFATRLRLGNNNTHTGGPYLARNTRNITPAMHHDTHQMGGSFKVGEGGFGAGTRWLVLSCDASGGGGGGNILIDTGKVNTTAVVHKA